MSLRPEWKVPALLADIAVAAENLGLAKRLKQNGKARRRILREQAEVLERKKNEARALGVPIEKVTAMQAGGHEAASRKASPRLPDINNRLRRKP